jgi:hypothetical protein
LEPKSPPSPSPRNRLKRLESVGVKALPGLGIRG